MNSSVMPLPNGTQIGDYQIKSLYRQATNHLEYLALKISTGQEVMVWEYINPQSAQRDTQSLSMVATGGREVHYESGKNRFLSAAHAGEIERFSALNTHFIVYPPTGPVVTMSNKDTNVLNYAGKKGKVYKSSSGGGGFLKFMVVLLLLGGGGYYGWDYYQKSEKEHAESIAKKQEELRLKKEEQEKAAIEASLAEEARLAAEEAKKKAAEDAKKKAENAADAKDDVEKKEGQGNASSEEDISPFAKDDDPRLDIFKKPIALVGLNAEKHTDILKQETDARQVAFDTMRWDKYKDFIYESLKNETGALVASKKFDLKKFDEGSKYRNAMYLYTLLNKMTKEQIKEVLEVYNGKEFFEELIKNENNELKNLLRVLPRKMDGAQVTKVLKNWVRFWNLDTGDLRKKYSNLALACALTDEESLPPSKTKYGQAEPLEEIYKYFRNKSESGALRGKITQLKPEELVYIVDVRLPMSELEWALKYVSSNQKSWGDNTIGMVRYRMDRAGLGVDPYKEYTFKEIEKEGGICMDQAYFAVNTAKANGIPAAYVTGDGPMGGHAWIVYMTDGQTWQNANSLGYTSGELVNPITKEKFNESLMSLSTDKKTGGPRLDRTKDLLELSSLMMGMGHQNVAKDLLQQAVVNTQAHPLPWEETIAFYENDKKEPKTTLKEWETLVQTIRNNFRKRPDFLKLAEQIEEKHVFPNKSLNDTKNAMAQQRRALERNTDEGRADLSKSALQREADLLIKAKKFDEVSTLYKKAFREYGERTDAFEGVIEQYFGYASENPEWQKIAVAEIDKAYNRYVDTGSMDLFKGKKEIGVGNKVASYWEQIGNKQKADQLRKKGETRLKRIERGIKKEN